VEDLDWVRAEHRSPQGLIKSSWEKRGDETVFTVTIPEDTPGRLILPNGEQRELIAGDTEISL
jgi:alpha-L-rhamnosidase